MSEEQFGGDYGHWWNRVRTAAPLAPSWFSVTATRVLMAPGVSSDALLIFAEALDEAADIAILSDGDLASQLRQLADLPRQLAPSRANQRG